MALINKINNTSSITFNGNLIDSNTVETLLTGLAPNILKAVDNLTAITNFPFSDIVADGATYVTDSFKVNTTTQTPTVTGKTLSYTIPTIAVLGVVTITG